jgi:hypothetical protein
LNVRRFKRIDCHRTDSGENSSPASISDTKNWLNWNGDLDNPNASDDDREADNESDMQLENRSEDSETPEEQNVRTAPMVHELVQPTGWSKKTAAKELMTVSIMETWWNKGIKNK